MKMKVYDQENLPNNLAHKILSKTPPRVLKAQKL